MALPRLERVNTLWFVTLGVTALAAAILVYILLLESALGAFSIRDASPTSIGQTSQPSVALLQSDYTKDVHRELNLRDTSTTWVDETLLSWRRFLVEKERNISFRDISDGDLEAGLLDDYDVLILPSVRALSDRQIEAIKEFMNGGGSVLATWTPGVYRPDASWRGWSFVEDVFGVEFQGFVERGVGNYRVYTDTFPGHTPPGIYLPEYLADASDPEPVLGTGSTSDYLFRETQRNEARRADFAPLRTYEWSDTLNTPPPTRDYARAEIVRAPLRDAAGERRVQDAVKVTYYTWIGGDPNAEIPFPRTNAGIRRFTLRGNTPLTANIPSGYRAKIQVYNPGVKVRVTGPNTEAAGFWYDFATDDLVSSDAVENTTGIAYGTYGEGRFVYLGFQRNAMGVGPDDREDWLQLADFFANMMNYLRRRPVIWVHDWPHPYAAAGMMTGVANDDVGSLGPVVDMMERENYPGTFFVNPENAGDQAGLVNRMYNVGDVGVYDSLRTRSDGSTSAQARRLQQQRLTLEGMVGGRPIRGYRPHDRGELARTGETMGGLIDADVYSYFMPDSIGRRTTPKVMGDPFEALTRIGVSTRSDKDILGGDATISMDLASSLLQDGIRRVEYEGGLFNLVYSSELLGANPGVLRGVARTLKGGPFWNASGDEIAHWWRLHQGLNADVEQRGPSRIFVRVSNDNGDVANDAAISIALGQTVNSVNIRPELINIFKVFGEGEDIPSYQLEENGTVLVIPIRELKPQQYRIFHIDLIGPNTDPLRHDG